jgi:glycoprotein-N-acetylgalactosamine 3-beta-galactosyltransferase
MWTKTQLIFSLIATSTLLDDFDYFLLGGDDLFVLVDNLKSFLSSSKIRDMSGLFVRTYLLVCMFEFVFMFVEYLVLCMICRFFCYLMTADQPLYIGREIHANKYTRFNSGGPGYVVNRAAALVLYRLINSPNGNCLPNILSSMEDLLVGRCFMEVR